LTKRNSIFKTHLFEIQEPIARIIKKQEVSIITAPAGCGKDFIQMHTALSYLVSKSYDNIIIAKPILEIGKSIGFLPGPQPIYSDILTPTGWRKMGDLEIGDKVIGRDGKPKNIVDINEAGVKDIYEITTTRGGKARSCGDHPWITKTYDEKRHNKEGSIRTTLQILETIKNPNTGPPFNHYLPSNDIVKFEALDTLLIPSYTLGAILGDGSISSDISISSVDDEIFDRINDEIKVLGLKLSPKNNTISRTMTGDYYSNKVSRFFKVEEKETGGFKIYKGVNEAWENIEKDMGISVKNKNTLKSRGNSSNVDLPHTYTFIKPTDRWKNTIKNELYNLKLEGTKAKTKFIPDIYKYSSVEDRISLLQGLMDTDGTIKKGGECTYTTISLKLAEDIMEVARSLGSYATMSIRDRRSEESHLLDGRFVINRHLCYTVNIPKFNSDIKIFYLKRKRDRIKKAKGTMSNVIKSIEKVDVSDSRCIVLDSEDHLYITNDFIVTHNSLKEKIEPYRRSFDNIITELIGNDDSGRVSVIKKKIIFEPVNYVRGNTFKNSVVILSEAQNCTLHELISFITRLDHTSKMFINGDCNQSDIGNKSGLKDLIKIIENIEGTKHIELGDDFQTRNKLIVELNKEYVKFKNSK